MKFSPRTLTAIAALALSLAPVASFAARFNPLVSSECTKCFDQAMMDSGNSRFRPALAKLEALLLMKPIKVGVYAPSIPVSSTGFDGAVDRAIRTWHESLGETIFQRASENEIPDVMVKFVKRVPGEGDDIQGMIEAEHTFKWSRKAHAFSITANIFVVDHVETKLLRSDEIAQVVTHELGHLLGLSDSNTKVGIMGPFVPGSLISRPSNDEVDALIDFRKKLRESIQSISKKV